MYAPAVPGMKTTVISSRWATIRKPALTPLAQNRNSEIYNHEEVRAAQLAGCKIKTTSDSAIVGYLYEKMGDCEELWNSLDGIFACVIVDERTGHFCAARDAMGICSFYWGKGADGSIWFASELKALQDNCETFEYFPPVSTWGWGFAVCCRRGWMLVAHMPVQLQGSDRWMPPMWGWQLKLLCWADSIDQCCRASGTAARPASWSGGSSPAGSTSRPSPASRSTSASSGWGCLETGLANAMGRIFSVVSAQLVRGIFGVLHQHTHKWCCCAAGDVCQERCQAAHVRRAAGGAAVGRAGLLAGCQRGCQVGLPEMDCCHFRHDNAADQGCI